VLSGVASLVAGAISMALGEYTSVRTQNEQLDLEVEKERRELERNPRGELAELVQMLQVRGVDADLAQEVAVQLHRDPDTALRLHVVAELGLNPADKPSPWTAAVSSFLTPRPWWYAALRQLLFGAVAAGVTYAIGLAIGAGVS
jgi:VIT1/CCC1 family predicted Fe2+/Mn2+ transporter